MTVNQRLVGLVLRLDHSEHGSQASYCLARHHAGRKLTVRGIKASAHTGASYGETGAAARQEILWDTEVPGLGRRREITGLEWSEVDLKERCLRIADSKTGAKIVPLSSAASAVLAAAPSS